MKIIKKNICLIAILSGVVGLSACSQDDALTPDGGTDYGNVIRFTTAIAGFTGSDAAAPGTRATINDDGKGSFANGDETEIIGIAYTNTGALPVTKGHPATYKDGTWTTDMTWDEFGEVELVLFSAFFPKRSLSDFDENGQMEINLPTDQSTSEQYAAYDWISATAAGKKADQPTIELTFYHCMYRLTVNLSLSGTPGTLTQEDVDNAKVVIKNMETKGVVNSGGGVMSDMNNTGDFTPLKSVSGNSFRVLLLPQYPTPGTPWIEVTVGGKTVTYAIPAGLTVLRAGTEQVVNLALTDDATTAKAITLSGQKNAVTTGVGGKAEYDISTTDIDISNSLLFMAGATVTWYAATEGGEPISLPAGINGYTLTSENDSKGVFSVSVNKTLPTGDYYFTVTYNGVTSNRVKLTVG